jgi:DNA end-binding protein Ku
MASTIWKGHITFGLVSLPVKLTAAARAETISFNQLHKKDNSRVKQVLYCQTEDTPVSRAELVKGYEYEKGKYVVIDEEDLKRITPKSARVMEILEFVQASELDAIFLESSYYLEPDEAGEKAYTLLFEAMKETGYYGVAKMTMHNREHIVVLRPGKNGMILHTMYYPDEVRATDEFRTNRGLVQDRELLMAKSLIQALAAPFEPTKYSDGYREKVRAMIDAKIQGEEVVAAPVEQEMAPVIDIMEALKSSLNALKKPVQTETHEPAQLQLEVMEAPKKKRAGGGGRRAG